MLSAKLKEATGNGTASTLYVDSVFSTWLYTGNGSTQTITNGIDLAGQGGMTWIKSRSAATDHKLTDTVRGATKALISDTTGAQTTDANGLTAFSSTGFSIGTDSVYNTNAATYASWTFRKAAKFFDVVTYTGTGANRTIAHNLGIAPGMVIVKRTDTTGNWQVYSNGLTSAAYSIQLNLTNAQASATTVWNSTAPTSSVFSVGTDATVNASGGTYVAYLFAHNTASDGIIQCGSYTGNGSATGPVVSLGWEPQYLMVKRTDSTSGADWYIFDNMRGMSFSSANVLRANDASIESTTAAGAGIIPTATGFQPITTAAGINATSGAYIYLAIRRPNKPPTSGTQVYNYDTRGSTAVLPNFKSGFVVDMAMWLNKPGGAPHQMQSRLTGVGYMNMSTTAAEVTTDPAITFDYMNGFYNGTTVNANQISWMFKRAPGFMDVVCYTGTSSATTQAHNLGVAPELMIVKCRNNGNTLWGVYNISLGATKALDLSSTAVPVTSSTYWNNTTPTASVFTLGSIAYVNESPFKYVAYLFATLAGISKVGSYTGNGTTQTINCGFTGGARFVLIKRTDSTGDWYVFDTARGMTTLTDPYLLLNSTAAEVATLGAVTSVTTGFAVNAAIVAAINTNAASYIFLAIA